MITDTINLILKVAIIVDGIGSILWYRYRKVANETKDNITRIIRICIGLLLILI